VRNSMAIGIGDRARFYELEGRNDYYSEGTIIGFPKMGSTRYKIAVDKIIAKGKSLPIPGNWFIYPPINGTSKRMGGFHCNTIRI
jgi:hypothetical protein